MRSTEELVCSSKKGDRAAFTELVRRYERAAWSTAWKVLRDHHTASDATQNAFVEAYCKLSHLRSSSQFGIWLIRIAHREALRIVRRSVPAQSLDRAAQVVMPMSTDSSFENDALMTAVASLPEHERLVVVLRYFNGHSIEEVAQLAGRPVGTVSKQISRAIVRLKSLIQIEEARS